MKFIRLWAQVVISALITLWAVSMFGRGIISGANISCSICFGIMAVAAYRVMLITAIHELKQAREK